MRRDTPRDEVPAAAVLARVEPASALRGLRSIETLDAAYGIWAELRAEHAARRLAQAEEQQRLEGEGHFLLGSVRSAGRLPDSPRETNAIATHDSLNTFLHDAEARLTAARQELVQRAREDEAGFQRAFEEIARTISERVQRYAQRSPPALVLWRRPVDKDRAVLHLERLSADAALVFLHLTTGQIAARFDFLSDDSTDASDREPTSFYSDTGLSAADLRPSPRRYPELIRGPKGISPVKTFLPLWVPRADGVEVFYRFLQRGPVLEAELLDGDVFRSVMTAPETELMAGQLLRWKLSGAIQLRLEMS